MLVTSRAQRAVPDFSGQRCCKLRLKLLAKKKAVRRVRHCKQVGLQERPPTSRATVPRVLYGIGLRMSLRRRTILCDGHSSPLTSDLKRCLRFWKCLRWSCLTAFSVPTFVTGGLRGSTATSALVVVTRSGGIVVVKHGTGEQVTSRYRQEDATQVETFSGVWMQNFAEQVLPKHRDCLRNEKKKAYFSLTVKQSACSSPDWTERKLTNLIEMRIRKNEKTRWRSDIQTTSGGGRWRYERNMTIVEIFVGGEFITKSNCWRPTCFTVSAGRSNNALTWIGAISVNTRTAVVAPIRWTIIDAWRKYKKY